MKLKFLYAILAACLALAACGEAPTGENTATVPDTSQEEPVGTAPDESTMQDASSQENKPAQEENTMRNIALGKVPDAYYVSVSSTTHKNKIQKIFSFFWIFYISRELFAPRH